MSNPKIQFVGSPCGHHGTYTFFKAFKYILDGKPKILSLGEFFPLKIWEDDDIVAVGEAQLFWEDKSSGQILVSLRLYFLPENTPEGRTDEHGEHEIVSLVDKVILRAEDVVHVIGAARDVKWEAGLPGVYIPPSEDIAVEEISKYLFTPPVAEVLDMSDVLKEKAAIGDVMEENSVHIIVLPYNKYCRLRALLKRVEGMEDNIKKWEMVCFLGGFLVPSKRTRLTFCKDVFEYAELEGNELLCNHLAPKLQGRPRKKKRKTLESEESESSSADEQRPWLKPSKPMLASNKQNSLIRGISKQHHSKHSSHSVDPNREPSFKNVERFMENDFNNKLHKFMRDHGTPLDRIPTIGNKQLNLYKLFKRVQEFHGYHVVCQKKLWKQIYDELVGRAASSTQLAASQNPNCGVVGLRKHYERLLLPYETFQIQQYEEFGPYYERKSSNKHRRMAQSQLNSFERMMDTHMKHKDSTEPSVSILQPTLPPNPIGASFKVADGGSTTITLIPVSEEQPALQTSVSNSVPAMKSDDPSIDRSPDTGELAIPKVPAKKDSLSNDLAKRPEITITPIPRGSSASANPQMQLSDLMKLQSPLGVAALQELAKVAENYVPKDQHPPHKKIKSDNSISRMNGIEHSWDPRLDSKSGATELISSALLRGMSMIEDPKLILPAHQSSKNMSGLTNLLPHTTIFPTQAPAAHQNIKSTQKFDAVRPEPIYQPQSVYSQSKNVYGKPTTPSKDITIDRIKNCSPDIEILDLRKPSDSRPRSTKNDKLEIELLDLSTRRDITVSAVSKPSSSKNRSQQSYGNIKSPDVSVLSAVSSMNNFSSPQISSSRSQVTAAPSFPTNSLLAALAAQTQPTSTMSSLPMGSPTLLQFLMSNGSKTNVTSHPSSQVPPGLQYMPMLDPAYYSMFQPGLIPTSSVSSSTASNNAAAAVAAAHAASAHNASMAQLAQLSSLGLSNVPNISPEAMNNLGIYKNYLPPGPLPAPHFLSGLMSPGSNSHPPGK